MQTERGHCLLGANIHEKYVRCLFTLNDGEQFAWFPEDSPDFWTVLSLLRLSKVALRALQTRSSVLMFKHEVPSTDTCIYNTLSSTDACIYNTWSPAGSHSPSPLPCLLCCYGLFIPNCETKSILPPGASFLLFDHGNVIDSDKQARAKECRPKLCPESRKGTKVRWTLKTAACDTNRLSQLWKWTLEQE